MHPALAALLCLLVLSGASYGEIQEAIVLVDIDVRENLLSVNLMDADLGGVFEEIAKRAGFELEMEKALYAKKLNANFRDMGMELGIARLLGRIGVKNYFIHYSSEGRIKKLEVYGFEERRSPSRPPAFAPAPPAPRVPSSQRTPAFVPPPVPRSMPQETAPQFVPEEETLSDELMEEVLDEGPAQAPYIPPRQEPVYIAPLPKGK